MSDTKEKLRTDSEGDVSVVAQVDDLIAAEGEFT